MKSPRLAWFVGLVLLALSGLWLWSATEWKEVTSPLPVRGPAAENRWYALQRLATLLGTSSEVRHSLSALPPAQATLLLTARHWDVVPGADQRLRQWVEAGGHLVLTAENSEVLHTLDWVGVKSILARGYPPAGMPKGTYEESDPSRDEDGSDTEDSADEDADTGDAPDDSASAPTTRQQTSDPQRPSRSVPAATQGASAPRAASSADSDSLTLYPPSARCISFDESPQRPPALGKYHSYQLCGLGGHRIETKRPVHWSAANATGAVAMTLKQGQGLITVVTNTGLWNNRRVVEDDNALLATAALRLHPGRVLWLIDDEQRAGLMHWLWHNAAPVLLLCGLALVAGLWRAGRRFGPLLAEAPLARRSVTEQVRGTAAFLQQHAPLSLHQAQRRALVEAAARHLPNPEKLSDTALAERIAALVGVPAKSLEQALMPAAATQPQRLARALQVLEIARRHLVKLKHQAHQAQPLTPQAQPAAPDAATDSHPTSTPP